MEILDDNGPLWVDGTAAGVSFGTVEETAARFTLLVGDVVGLFRKLDFEREQFSRAHHANPPQIDGIVYTCLNFLVTAQSLYDWFRAEVRTRDGAGFDLAGFNAMIAARIPYHGLCRDVANTLKHRDFRDGLWPGGAVKLDYLPGGPGGPLPLAVLVFHQPGGLNMDALGLLTIIVQNWRMLLMDEGLLPAPGEEIASDPASADGEVS